MNADAFGCFFSASFGVFCRNLRVSFFLHASARWSTTLLSQLLDSGESMLLKNVFLTATAKPPSCFLLFFCHLFGHTRKKHITNRWVQNQVSAASKVNLYCIEGRGPAALKPSCLLIVPQEEDSREITEGYYDEMAAVTQQSPVMSQERGW